MKISILQENVSFAFNAGAIVATATASEGSSPYTYSLATGLEYFSIDSSTGIVTVKADMNIGNIQPFSVTVTDSTSGNALTATSDEVYPNIQAAIQNRFSSANRIYKITQDIDLAHGILTIPSSCTLDFQGGKITNGTITLDRTLVLPLGLDIKKYITATITGTYAEGQTIYDSDLKKMKLWNGESWVNLDGTALQ